MWIMVAGPCASGGADAANRAARLRTMNEAALTLHRMGHVPVIGVNMALPVIGAAGGGEAAYEAIMLPLSLALAERSDTCPHLGGASPRADAGADAEAARFRARGRPVWRRLEDVPAVVAR